MKEADKDKQIHRDFTKCSSEEQTGCATESLTLVPVEGFPYTGLFMFL
jgi:hypothetical protein